MKNQRNPLEGESQRAAVLSYSMKLDIMSFRIKWGLIFHQQNGAVK